MLLDFSVSNVLSFKEPVRIALESSYSGAEIFKNNLIYQGPSDKGKKTYVQNAAVVYGSNASGKSNLIECINYLIEIVKSSYIENNININKFAFSEETNHPQFELRFIQSIEGNGYEFYYNISVNEEGEIIKELLTYKEILKTRTKSEKIIFSREKDIFNENHKDIDPLVDHYQTQNIDTKASLSFFVNDINKSYYNQTINKFGYKLLKSAYDFIVKKIVIASNRGRAELASLLHENHELKDTVITALKDIDNSIEDFEFVDITEQVTAQLEEMYKNGLSNGLFNEAQNRKPFMDVRTLHRIEGKDYRLRYGLESRGTKKFINEFIDIIDCIENNKIYIVDEMENHYHELIQRYIMNLFLEQNQENNAQIIITTHSGEFLDPERLSKEQIWFMEKDRNTEGSELYRLSDFNDVTYKNHNWKSLYLQGRLGAVPKVID